MMETLFFWKLVSVFFEIISYFGVVFVCSRFNMISIVDLFDLLLNVIPKENKGCLHSTLT